MKYRLTDKPYHQHDCATCAYIGTLVNQPDTAAIDVYLHGSMQTGTLIARTGEDGDYASAPVEVLVRRDAVLNQDSDLIRALNLLSAVS